MRAVRQSLSIVTGGFLLCVCLLAPVWGANPSTVCPLAGERPMRVVHFYFGRAIKGRLPLTDGEWSVFAAEILSPNFPEGFTSYDGDGQWRNQRTGQIVR